MLAIRSSMHSSLVAPEGTSKFCLLYKGANSALERTLALYRLRVTSATRKIQGAYRNHLKVHLPRMLSSSGNLKALPKLKIISSCDGKLRPGMSAIYGGRELKISEELLGYGKFAKVYAGTLGDRHIAVKIGEILEVRYLKELLTAEADGIPIVVPIPLDESSSKYRKGSEQIAVMPRVQIVLKQKGYLGFMWEYHVKGAWDNVKEIDRQLKAKFGIHHNDLHCGNVGLNNGKECLVDFGLMMLKRLET